MTSATYRPAFHTYGTPFDTKGPGRINGNFNINGTVVTTGATTPLGNTGAGFFARSKTGGYLPPPAAPKRINGVLVR